ncbi:MAG TPA: aminotransferase class IV [Acidimicrobiia bacterium]|nr:aminotransferase class IV [Acidimicrobiia bacterium]
MDESTAYFNGEWVPLSQVRIDPADRGFVTGDAVFDAARTFGGVEFLLEEHVDRLYRSLHVARIDPGLPRAHMLGISREVIDRNQQLIPDVGDFQVWQGVTRGPGRWAHEAGPPTVYVKVSGIDFAKYAHLYATGAHAIVTRASSLPYGAADPKLKTHSRMHFNLAELEAARSDRAGWPVLCDAMGNLGEGSGYNLFVVRDGGVSTPPAGSVLAGISRAYTLELAASLGISTTETLLQPFDLYTADEAFFTGTSPCILPVTRADGLTIGSGQPGPITSMLLHAWGDRVGLDIAAQAIKYA